MEARAVSDVLKEFHSLDRNTYRRLIYNGFGLNHSKYIVAFWYLLDARNHYRFMAEKIKTIADAEFNELANETLDYLFNTPNLFKRLKDVPNFQLVLKNKEAMGFMEWLVKEVFEKAFNDIVHQFLSSFLLGINHKPNPVVLLPSNRSLSSSKPNNYDEERSLFFTFSKGHPVSIEELETLIRRWNFEDRVEKIRMNPPLSARVFCKSPADVRRIVGDEEGRTVHFSINAKDVRVRHWHVNGKKLLPMHGSITMKRAGQQRQVQ